MPVIIVVYAVCLLAIYLIIILHKGGRQVFNWWDLQFTKRELLGTAGEFTFWYVAILGPIMLYLYSVDKFPLIAESPGPIFFISITVSVLTSLLCIWFRKTIMPNDPLVNFNIVGVIISLAYLPYGTMVTANAILDRSHPVEVHTIIDQKVSGHKVKVFSVERPYVQTSLKLSYDEFNHVRLGDGIQLQIKSGALGERWISAYIIQYRIPRKISLGAVRPDHALKLTE